MSIRSRIRSSVHRRKRLSLYKKALYIFIFILFFISLFILGLTWQKIRIQNVQVTGNSVIDKNEIENIAENVLSERYVWLVPTDNFLLFKGGEIKNQILNDYKKINTVHISYSDFPNSIDIEISDRSPEYLWCATEADCYFMDKDGFVYEKAPMLTPNPYMEFFGNIQDDAIGKNYLQMKFSDISEFLKSIKDLKLNPIVFRALDEHEYELQLSEGGRILLNDKNSFEKYLKNIQTLINNGFLKTDIESLKKLDYVDLRFGNKVPIKLK